MVSAERDPFILPEKKGEEVITAETLDWKPSQQMMANLGGRKAT